MNQHIHKAEASTKPATEPEDEAQALLDKLRLDICRKDNDRLALRRDGKAKGTVVTQAKVPNDREVAITLLKSVTNKNPKSAMKLTIQSAHRGLIWKCKEHEFEEAILGAIGSHFDQGKTELASELMRFLRLKAGAVFHLLLSRDPDLT